MKGVKNMKERNELEYDYSEEILEEPNLEQQDIHFTEEEIKRIDRLLAEVDEEQKRNGNRLYSHAEVWGQILGEENYKLLHRLQ